jgi:muramoyltetrapeptide carboxypeptidase
MLAQPLLWNRHIAALAAGGGRMSSRRAFLGTGAVGLAAALTPARGRAATRTRQRRAAARPTFLKPPRLRPGDTVGLINPSGVPPGTDEVEAVRGHLDALDLRVKAASGCSGPGTPSPAARAREVETFFADPGVTAILPLRGGWGSARLLQHLDYGLIARHPKVLMGYSDVAALLVAIHSRSGLVTFHGPMGNSEFVPFTVQQLRSVLFEGRAATLTNPAGVTTLTRGKARGRLLGGNLTVLSSIVGSSYIRSADDIILFLEEVREPASEVDRMLTQLELSGILGRVKGLVFGQCTQCLPPAADRSLTFERVLEERVRPLGIPAWTGALIGHIDGQFTVPIGLPVEIDAGKGTIRLLEPAVL